MQYPKFKVINDVFSDKNAGVLLESKVFKFAFCKEASNNAIPQVKKNLLNY